MTDLVIGADAAIDVDWDDDDYAHSAVTVTEALEELSYRWGARRRSNPQRPLLDPGSGSMVLIGEPYITGGAGVLTAAQLHGRHRFRIRHNPRTGGTVPPEVNGWAIREDRPTRGRSAGRRAVWRLVGQLDDDVRADISVTQPASPLASNADEFTAMLTTAAGRAVTVEAPTVSLGAFNFAGRRGEFISEISRVLASTPYGGRSAAISIIAPGSATVAERLDGATYAIDSVSSQADTAQIFNQLVAFAAAAMTGETQRIDVPLELNPTAATDLPVMMTAQFASLGDDWTYTVADPTQITLILAAPELWERYYSTFFSRFQYRVRPGSPIFRPRVPVVVPCTASALLNVRTVTVTVTAVETATVRRTWAKYRDVDGGSDLLGSQSVTITVPWANLPADGTLLNPFLLGYQGNFTTWEALLTAAGFRNMSDTTYTSYASATVEATPQYASMTAAVTARRTSGAAFSRREVSNADSVALWGPRPLTLPAWLQSAADAVLQAMVDALAAPREVHVVDLAMPQPTEALTARVASLEPGDVLPVYIVDPRTATDIDAVCVVRSVEWRLKARALSVCRVTFVETGLTAAPRAPDAPQLGALTFSPLGANYQGNITWSDRGAAATSWEIEWTVAGTADTQTFNVPGLRADTEAPIPPGSAVSVRVRGHNAVGAGAWSTPASGTAPAAQLPVAAAPIVNIAAVPSGAEGSSVELSATLSGGTYDGAVAYSWSVTAGTLDDNTAARPRWTRPHVAAATDVTIRLVVTVSGTGSNARAGTSDTADDDVVSRVTDVPLTFGSATIGDQAWQATVPITALVLPTATGGTAPLAYSLSPALPAGLTFTAATRTISGTPSTPTTVRTYRYRVTDADNDTADLTFAAAVTAAPVTPTAPSVPRQFMLSTPSSTSILTVWQRPATVGSGVSGYRVRHRVAGTGSWTTVDVGAVLTHTISGLTASTGYEVEVQAYGPGGSSPWATGAIATPATPPPSATDRLQLEDSTDTLLLENDDHLELEG